MFTERKPSHRESLLAAGGWEQQSLTGARGRWSTWGGAPSQPLSASDFQREAGVALDRVRQGERSSDGVESIMGSDVLLLKIQREGGPGKG